MNQMTLHSLVLLSTVYHINEYYILIIDFDLLAPYRLLSQELFPYQSFELFTGTSVSYDAIDTYISYNCQYVLLNL